MTRPVELTATYIDSQTLGGVVVAFESADPLAWSSWTTQSILVSTCVLMSMPELRISPSARVHHGNLQAYTGTPGSHGVIGAELAGTIRAYVPDQELTQQAARTVARWANENHKKLAESYQKLVETPDYDSWMDYETSKGWATATLIINGIIDEAFAKSVARILDLPESQIRSILDSSRDRVIVEKWLSNYRGEDKEIAKQMFTVGALLRGRYHDRVAEQSSMSIIHHPVRNSVLKKMKHEDSVFRSSNSLEYLSKIVIAASLSETSPSRRIKMWSGNVKLLRHAILDTGEIYLPDDDLADEVALKHAIRAARACEIRAHPQILDKVLYHSLGLGVGAATSFLLSPWLFPVGFYASELALSKVGSRIVPGFIARSNLRLSHLAKSIPGRLNLIQE